MTDYKIEKANVSDINDIMRVEKDGFAVGIREQESVFLERIKVFGDGFLLLKTDPDCETGLCLTKGYFCSELWERIPDNSTEFSLGHSAERSHCSNGNVLYISSYAIMGALKGRGLGKAFFRDALKLMLVEHERINDVVLLVNEDWKGAVHIYESFGFVKYDEIKGFFEVKEGDSLKVSDGYLMKCSRETLMETLV